MKRIILWLMAVLITITAAIYQRMTGPTNPKREEISLNDTLHKIRLIRSIGLDERSEIKLSINDSTIKARVYYKRFKTDDEYQQAPFRYKEYPVDSFIMNRIFGITREKGLFAALPPQPPAGKIQYYIEFTDKYCIKTLMKESPVIIRYKGGVPVWILTPHILLMFLAMLFSTASGLFAAFKMPVYKKYGTMTLYLLIAGGLIFGPIVQKYAFGEFWTGIPFGWDMTDNKLLITLFFWIGAVIMNRKTEKPFVTIIAAAVLLLVYSIPHNLFGSELDYNTGKVIQGFSLFFFYFHVPKKS